MQTRANPLTPTRYSLERGRDLRDHNQNQSSTFSVRSLPPAQRGCLQYVNINTGRLIQNEPFFVSSAADPLVGNFGHPGLPYRGLLQVSDPPRHR